MSDDRFEEIIKLAAREYNPPPETPKEAMWTSISGARVGTKSAPSSSSRWWQWGMGIAAVLAAGIALGRLSVTNPPAPTATEEVLATGPSAGEEALVFHVAAADHFLQTDAFLSLFRTEASSGRADEELAAWGHDLLAMTRLMIDSPAGEDPNLRVLLEDLELLLVQIAQYTAQKDDIELTIIEDGLEENGIQMRLQAALADASLLAGGDY